MRCGNTCSSPPSLSSSSPSSSMDVKDILGLPRTGFPTPQEKKSRPPRDSHRKPDGISREVYALTGGMAPLMPSLDISNLKRRALRKRK